MIRALLAEDETSLAEILKESLFERQIDLILAKDGEEAWSAYEQGAIDILITDIRMPRLDGLSLIEKIRVSDKELPIIIITVKSETEDLEKGFEVGADDYLRKPFSTRELVARIKALTRRVSRSADRYEQISAQSISMIKFIGRYELDVTAQKLIFHEDQDIYSLRSLSFREAAILDFLISAAGEIVENERFLKELWGSNDIYNLNSLYVFITRLKRYLAKDARILIVNARGIGYKIVCK